MKLLKTASFALLVACASAMAAPASEGSIRQLLEVTEARSLVDGMRGQFDAMMDGAVRQSLSGKAPTERQQQAIDTMKARTVAVMKAQLSWERLEPMYLRLYRESFSEDEVTGMLAFYRTPAGRAVVHKLPLLMQNLMAEVQGMMGSATPQLQRIQQEFAAEMAAASR